MERRGSGQDRHGRTWTIRVGTEEEAAEADSAWYAAMTPEERVMAVQDCLLSSLKARGIDEIPRLRRICRVVQRP